MGCLLALVSLTVLAPGNAPAAGVDGTEKWRFYPGGWYGASPAIGADGTIYFECLTAVNPDGTLKWRYVTGGISSPMIGPDGTIYQGSNTYFYAIKPDGTLKWKYPGGFLESAPAIGADGTIYMGSGDGCFYAFRPDGAVKWKYQGSNVYQFVSSPAIGADGTIYVGLCEGDSSSFHLYLCAFRPDGALKWKYSTYTTLISGSYWSALASPAIGADGAVYVAAWFWPGFFAVRPDGSTKWWNSLQINDIGYVTGMYCSPVIGVDGTIYLALASMLTHNVFAFTSGGALKWIHEGAGETPAIGRDGTIYAGGDCLYALNPDGTEKWGFGPLGGHYGSPVIGPDGTIYVDGPSFLYAVNSTCGGPASNAPWPMFHRDPKHTGRMPSMGTAPLHLMLLSD